MYAPLYGLKSGDPGGLKSAERGAHVDHSETVASGGGSPGGRSHCRCLAPCRSPGEGAGARAVGEPFRGRVLLQGEVGQFDEFTELYKRNHYPTLQRLQKLGRIVSMSAAHPINHASEAARWDLRF